MTEQQLHRVKAQHTAGQLGQMIDGTLFGNADKLVTGANAIESAGPDDITFVAEDRHLTRLKNCNAGVVLLCADHTKLVMESNPNFVVIGVKDPQLAFQTILPLYRKVRGRQAREISPAAYISPSAKLGKDCYVGPGASIGDDVVLGDNCEVHPGVVIGPGCRLGRDVVLYPNVVLYHDVEVGDRAIIHAGAVIGADGFGYRYEEGRFEKVAQLGSVQIHVDVEIGACATVDRGAIGPTVIGAGTKLDNLVQVAHNCQIGRHNVFAAQVGMAGSSSTGDYVRLGGQAGIKDHIHLGTGCMVGAASGVHRDVPAGETWIGFPASPEQEQKRLVFTLKRVPEMREDLRELKKQVAMLTQQLASLQEMKAAG